MKIAYLSTFYPYRGGISQFNTNLYNALRHQQHNVTPYTFTTQYPNFLFPGKTQYVTANDKAEKIESIRTLSTVNPLTWLKTASLLQKEQPDILLMKYWMTFFAPSLGYVSGRLKRKGTKVITVLDNVIPHEKRFIDKPFNKYFLSRNTGFIAMSESVKNDLLSLQPNAKVILKPHPLYDHFGEKLSKQKAAEILKTDASKKTILFFGIIRDYKGLDVLLDAFKNFDSSYELIIAGEPYGSFEKYAEIINAHPLKENIKLFNHYIDDDMVPLFFSASDVVVLPYKSATQSGITSIAYHFNTPIIATNVGGLAESIYHNKTGIIVDECSSSAVENGIREYFQNNLYLTFSSEINKLKEELSWKKFATDLIEFSKTL